MAKRADDGNWSVAQLKHDDLQFIWHKHIRTKDYAEYGPIVITKGRGVHVWDADGKRYIDGMSSQWNVFIGHGRSEVNDAIKNQLDDIAYYHTSGMSNIPSIRLARLLVELTGGHLTRVFFTSGGSDAMDTALKIVRQYGKQTGKRTKYKIISRRLGMHGNTLGALSVNGITRMKAKFEPLLPGFPQIEAPYCYRCPLGLKYPSCGIACAKLLEQAVQGEDPDTVAAFVAEPVMGAGGVIVPPPEYFPIIRETCDRYGLVFIADEVLTGFGRTGKMFGLDHWDVKPDIMTLAKGINSGYIPLGAVMAREVIYDSFQDVPDNMLVHGFTYSGHPVATAAALANLDIITRERLPERAAQMGQYLHERLRGLYEYPQIGDVRGLGLVAAIEFVQDKESKTPLPVAKRIHRLALERGLIVRPLGTHMIAVAPPLVISRSEIDDVVAILDECVRTALAVPIG